MKRAGCPTVFWATVGQCYTAADKYKVPRKKPALTVDYSQ